MYFNLYLYKVFHAYFSNAKTKNPIVIKHFLKFLLSILKIICISNTFEEFYFKYIVLPVFSILFWIFLSKGYFISNTFKSILYNTDLYAHLSVYAGIYFVLII